MFEVSAQARVRRGARWLDRHRPGWAGQVDRAQLDMNSARNCIWGQLAGDYYLLPFSLVVLNRQVRFGFYADADFGYRWDGEELTAAWRNEIQRRRSTPKQEESHEHR